MNRWVNLMVVAVAFGLGACGGGGGKSQNPAPAPLPDTTAPTVVSVTPANGLTGIASTTTVSVNFSEAVDCTTVTNSSVALAINGTPVAGTVVCSGSTAVFTPQAPLAAGGTFSLQIGTTVRDRANNPLSGAFTSTFLTAAAPSPASYRVSGALAGLDSGRGLVLEVNGAAPLSVTSNGTFAFQASLADGAAYNVTVAAQPFGQNCVLANATGVVRAADVGNLTVLCAVLPVPMSVVAIVPADVASGIAVGTSVAAIFSKALDCTTVTGSNVSLTAGGASVPGALDCSGSGLSFVPAAALAPSTTYTVDISGVRSASGEALSSAVSSRFTTGASSGAVTHTVGGTVSGVTSGRGLTLQLNAANPLSITSAGNFVFPVALAEGAAYQVSVLAQPSDQTCVVSQGSGIVRAPVIDVTVSCTTNTYTVSAVLSGLGAGRTITLRNNGGDDVTYSSDGTLTFRTALAPLSSYDVTVATPPTAQTCSVVNGRGSVGLANVTNIAIQCVENRYTLGVRVTGLLAGNYLVLEDLAGMAQLGLGINTYFNIGPYLTYGTAYNFNLRSQPPFQTCVVTNGSGVARDTDVTDILVTCAPGVVPGTTTLAVAFGLKQLRFSWAAAADATYYRLMSSPDGAAPFAQVGADITGTSANVDVSVHLTDWVNARYRVDACNPIGCTPSAAVDAVAGAASTVGYFKAPNNNQLDFFGFAVALSGDGRTLAVSAPFEDSMSSGVNGDATDNSSDAVGAVYVFTRPAPGLAGNTSGWQFQAYIKPDNPNLQMTFGYSLALSRDGELLAVGSPTEASCTTQVGGSSANRACANRGAVYVFSRAGHTWVEQAYIKGRRPNDDSGTARWLFGMSVDLDAYGETLVVGAPYDDSALSGIVLSSNPTGPVDHSRLGTGAAYVFTRTRSAWTQEAYLKASNNYSIDVKQQQYGMTVAISGDGDTVAVGAPGESGGASVAVNGDVFYDCVNNVNCLVGRGAVYVVHRTRTNGGLRWTQEAYLKSMYLPDTQFGGVWNAPLDLYPLFTPGQIALDDRGETLVVGVPSLQMASVFARDAGAGWVQQAQLAAPPPAFPPFQSIATSPVALSADGNLLAIAGADEVRQYRRTGAGWVRSAVTTLAPLGSVGFGSSVALSADGATMAVGSDAEYGAATTIQGDPTDRTSPFSGAAYVY